MKFYIIIVSGIDGSGDDVDVFRPTNTIAIAGQKIILPCSSHANNESRWDFYDLDSGTPKNIYNGNRHMANTGRRVTIDFNSCSLRTCNLTIESVELEDAGYYVCFESSSKATARKAASLVVLGQFFRPPGTAVPDGLLFYRRCFLFFATLSPRSLDRSP